ncbi:hypothetical protein PZB75_14620 [Streptomyces sp. AM 4-1-1]|uniref:hypothetical protein n=1 Tax=Streptomyces sp. AM 4-1-1 TaxID=3028710 RepID=UPI0023B981EC|nr:hypothetical protein [Streptomyces sp. AM 4-1-1]WEH37749.1 hypothetical protein PZB75_14620 [Streptomyces sp. AM 4-1-1]
MRNGALSARPTSVPHTSATASSSSPGLPTPAARDWRGGGQRGQFPTAIGSLLPTPSTSESTGAGHAAQGGMNLRHVVSLLPTPVRADGERQSSVFGRGNPTLRGALLPTPRASANENRQTRRTPSQQAGKHGLCLAAEVADPTGAPTPKRSNGGKRSPGVPPPSQLTIWDD